MVWKKRLRSLPKASVAFSILNGQFVIKKSKVKTLAEHPHLLDHARRALRQCLAR